VTESLPSKRRIANAYLPKASGFLADITIVQKRLCVPAMKPSLNRVNHRLRRASTAFLAAMAIMIIFMVSIQPAAAMVGQPILPSATFAAMSNKRINAAAKDAEGKLESAYGDLAGDAGHQIKGKAKQVQASAMNVTEDIKQGARSTGKKIADATGE
jgi:uncharacterized protein YjbJ (UPF0337 family)